MFDQRERESWEKFVSSLMRASGGCRRISGNEFCLSRKSASWPDSKCPSIHFTNKSNRYEGLSILFVLKRSLLIFLLFLEYVCIYKCRKWKSIYASSVLQGVSMHHATRYTPRASITRRNKLDFKRRWHGERSGS